MWIIKKEICEADKEIKERAAVSGGDDVSEQRSVNEIGPLTENII